MKRTLLVLVVGMLAGCTDSGTPPASGGHVDAALITPDVWNVSGNTDHVLVWAHNLASSKTTIEWRVENADGSALPSGLNISASASSVVLEPKGTKTKSGGRTTYPDWAWTLLTVTLGNGTAAGDHHLRLNTSVSTHAFTLRVGGSRVRVSHPGDNVNVVYDGHFVSSGARFDQGSFSTKLGSGQTVPGFDYGLMGLAQGEGAALIIPAALAYGYDNTDPGYTKFNGETLRFDVGIQRFENQ